jgi:hypothetical protein
VSYQGGYLLANFTVQAQLEKLKAGIAETVKKAGMQSELDLVPEKGVKVRGGERQSSDHDHDTISAE